jgi:hypothetical protein
MSVNIQLVTSEKDGQIVVIFNPLLIVSDLINDIVFELSKTDVASIVPILKSNNAQNLLAWLQNNKSTMPGFQNLNSANVVPIYNELQKVIKY